MKKVIENDLQEQPVFSILNNDLEHIDFNVVQSNSLIEAKHDLELNEHKIINAVISQIKQYDQKINTFEFTFSQLCELCNFEERNLKRTLHRVCLNLMSKTFYLNDTYIDENGNKAMERRYYHWIRLIKLRQNKLVIRLSDDLMPLLLNLKKDFTSERLSAIEEYENEYALRLDMLFTMYFNKKTSKMSLEQLSKYCMRLEFDLDELKYFLSCDIKYPRFNSFNERVLSPLLEELNNKKFYRVSMEKISENKKVKKIMFFVSLGERNTKVKSIKQKIANKEKDIIMAILGDDYGISNEIIKKIINNNDVSFIKDTLKLLNKNNIENPKDFLIQKLLPENRTIVSNEEKYAFLQSL